MKWRERRHAGARADHDDVAAGVGGDAETLVRFDEHRHLGAFLQRGEEGAGGADMAAAMGVVGQFVHGQVDLVADPLAAGGDGVQAVRGRAQRGDQRGRVPPGRPAVQHIDQLVIAENGGQFAGARRFQQAGQVGVAAAFGHGR